jgi:hypothetical protein
MEKTKQSVDNFRRIMLWQLEKEQEAKSDKTLAKSHFRSKVFSPVMVEEINQTKFGK